MSGVMSDKRENVMPMNRTARVHTGEGQRPIVGYEWANKKTATGMRLALAKVKRAQASKCAPPKELATPRIHPAMERVKAANQRLTAASGLARHTKRASAAMATATRHRENWIMRGSIQSHGRGTPLPRLCRRNSFEY